MRDEGFSVVFPEEPQAFFLSGEGAHHGYEGLWRHQPISALWDWSVGRRWRRRCRSSSTSPGGPKLALLQADLDDYPALYLSYRTSHPRTLRLALPAARAAASSRAASWTSTWS